MKHLFYVCKVLNKDETGSFCYGKISFNDCVFLKLDLMYEGGWWQVCSFVARVCCLRRAIPLFGWFRLFNSIHVISILPMFTSLSTLGFADYRRKTSPINFRKIFVKPKSKLLGRFAKKSKFENMSNSFYASFMLQWFPQFEKLRYYNHIYTGTACIYTDCRVTNRKNVQIMHTIKA